MTCLLGSRFCMPIVLLSVGFAMAVYAAPCYVDTAPALSTTLGCTKEAVVRNGGSMCPGIGGDGNGCADSVIPVTVRVGVTGNQSAGRQSFTVAEDACYSFRTCSQTLSWAFFPPKWKCSITTATPLGNNWNAQHASGPSCGGG